MQLTQPEIIQILRKRANLNQAELGSRAFNTNMDSGRTKIKNIELGRQRPTEDDIRRIADCLTVSPAQLMAADAKAPPGGVGNGAVLVSQKVVDLFPDLGNYLEMLENAARLEDFELIEYLAAKIAGIMSSGPAVDSGSHPTITSGTKGG